MEISYVSAVIFVRDIAISRRFHESVLGQQVLMDHGPSVGFHRCRSTLCAASRTRH